MDGERGPELALDWEEGLFRVVDRWWRAWRARREPPDPEAYAFSAEARVWEVLGSVLAGVPLRVLAARDVGGLRGADLLLPARVALGGRLADHREVLLVRVLVAGELRRAGLDAGAWGDRCAEAEAFRAATRALGAALPGFAALYARVVAVLTAAARSEAERAALALLDLDAPLPSPLPASLPLVWGGLVRPPAAAAAPGAGEAPPRIVGSERRGRPVDEVRRVTLDERRARERVVMHSFEKIETLEEHRGQLQRMDGADELDAHAEALDELELRELVRGGDPPGSLLRADPGLGGGIPDVATVEPGEAGLPYDEWDASRGAYRRGWCTVYPTSGGPGDAAWAHAAGLRTRRQADLLFRRLSADRQRRRVRARERDGDDVDLDALLDDRADRRAGRGRSERLFLSSPRLLRSVATTVLLDVSLSTDAWIDGARVLDVAREAVLVLGDVAERLGDELQVLAFASHTRNRCRVWSVHERGEPWARGRARLGALRPQGYTRIGPALRHGAHELLRAPADHRVLLLVSDGRPTDLDHYEGRHGVADVKQALREARAAGVHTHVLALDTGASAALAATFAEGSWQVVPHVRAVPEALAFLYARLHR